MTLERYKKIMPKIPAAPGVYFFLGRQKHLLYIGRATNLRARVRSYFTRDLEEKRGNLIKKMVAEAIDVEWTAADSVLEALILEANLIRTHQPTYNSRSKDDKSYNHLIITNEEWPRVLVARGKDLTERFTKEEIRRRFGPFTNGALFRAALRIVRRLFKFYDTKNPLDRERSKMARSRLDFNRQLGLYPNNGEKKEYERTIRHLTLFFEGKKQRIIKELERDMMAAARSEEFERADLLKRRIFALRHIEDVSLLKDEARLHRDKRRLRIEAYDVAHLGGKDMVGAMAVVEGGEAAKSEYRRFKLRNLTKANDPAALVEILVRRLAHPEWPYPQLVVVDGNHIQKRAAERTLRAHGCVIPVAAVVKNERHQVSRLIGPDKMTSAHRHALLFANAEAHRFAVSFHRLLRRRGALR